MSDDGPEHPLNYRQEIVKTIFDLIRSGESCAVVGCPSMGKSRMLNFILRPDVQQYYLGESSATWLVLVDCHRLAEVSEWGFYELLLTALAETASPRFDDRVHKWLNDLRQQAIVNQNSLLARRYVELTTRVLCREYGIKLCFVCDEFDEAYHSLTHSALANLRALRDADRYHICYILVMRDHPARVRTPDSNEGFYELVSRSVLGLKPLIAADAERVVAQLAVRRRFPVSPNEVGWLLHFSGGHPGLLVALFDLLLHERTSLPEKEVVTWVINQPQVNEECRKLWGGLSHDEQLTLSRLAEGIGAPNSVREYLLLKGLLQTSNRSEAAFFSPVFEEYVSACGSFGAQSLWVDESATVAWVEGQRIRDLSPLEFDLLRYLYRHVGQVCSRDDIISALYPGESADIEGSIADNRVDSLVRRLRKAIEPIPEQPRYLLTIRGHGYRLIEKPE